MEMKIDIIWSVLMKCRDIEWKEKAAERIIYDIPRLRQNLSLAKNEDKKINIMSTISWKGHRLRAIRKEIMWWNNKHPTNLYDRLLPLIERCLNEIEHM